jgi:formyltetrahydrofolate deformylase
MFSRSLPCLKYKLSSNLATLRVHGPDGKGIVAACSNLLDCRGYSIVGTEHWTDRKENLIFLRIAFDKENVATSMERHTTAEEELERFCRERHLHYDVNWRTRKARVAIMVSNYAHCLWELLLRHEAQELDCDIVAVLSNHATLKPVADTFHIPFEVFPITPDNKQEQEEKELELLQNTYQVDLIVLARYMQVLSENFLSQYPNQIINIHHSFLPAFSGSKPYHAAYARGVKLIGATAHYTTAMLDEGPIIEQVSECAILHCSISEREMSSLRTTSIPISLRNSITH